MPEDKREFVEIAVALIRRGDKLLVGKRRSKDRLAGKWEFPGGKIEKGEAPEDCIRRELREELGVEVLVGGLFRICDYDYAGEGLYRRNDFWCEIKSGEPNLVAHDELRWVNVNECSQLDLLESDKELIPLLAAQLSKK